MSVLVQVETEPLPIVERCEDSLAISRELRRAPSRCIAIEYVFNAKNSPSPPRTDPGAMGISPQLYKLQHSADRRAAQGNLRLAYCFAHRNILWHERLELAQMGRWRAMHELEYIAGFMDLAPLRTTGAWVSGA